ncbi:hypothetical protein GCM10009119_21230 [Algoriphagus jejuensis]|uniref:Uncharacterized protein n=1 Tax=Algoriphagus jejuensis TaxID=419934 RepID=A0ABP3YCG5_9BACT
MPGVELDHPGGPKGEAEEDGNQVGEDTIHGSRSNMDMVQIRSIQVGENSRLEPKKSWANPELRLL